MLTDNYDRALIYAKRVHRGHTRKSTRIPYLSHLLAVSALVMEAGGDEDMAIAALLHDAPEDRGGLKRLRDINKRFGRRVARIVESCSDSLKAKEPKDAWDLRKRAYLEHLKTSKDLDYVLVTAADKLHNAQAMLRDYRNYRARGKADAFWRRFTRGGEKSAGEIVGYYLALSRVIERKLKRSNPQRKAIARELKAVVATLIAESRIVPNLRWQRAPK